MKMEEKFDKSKWIPHVFHVDLSDHEHLHSEDLWLHASSARHSLVKHTHKSRAILRDTNPKFCDVDDANLTHYTDSKVMLPYNQVVRVHVKHTLNNQQGWHGDHAAAHAYIVVPPLDEDKKPVPPPSGGDPPPPSHHHVDWVGTAKSIIFHHPDLITHDPTVASLVFDYMDQNQNKEIYQLISNSKGTGFADILRAQGPPTPNSGYARQNQVTVNNSVTNKTTTTYEIDPTQTSIEGGQSAMTAMMIATKNDPALKGKKWTQQIGQSTDTSSGGAGGKQVGAFAADLSVAGDAFAPQLEKGSQYGTTITIKDSGQHSDGTDWVTLTVDNTYIRYLGVYVSFYGADDDDNHPMDIKDWEIDGGGLLSKAAKALDLEYDTMKFCGLVSSMNNFMAIPTGPAGTVTFTITLPSTKNGYSEDAVRAKIFCCGLGIGDNSFPRTNVVGGLFTAFINLAIPGFMLGFAVAAQSYKPLYDLLGNKKVWIPLLVAGGAVFAGRFGYTGKTYHKFDWSAFTSLSSLLFNKAATKALVWCEAEMAGEEAAEEIPFAGWLIVALNIATGIAQLAETIVEILESPFHIDNTITATITSKVTVNPDPRHQAWPAAPAGSKSFMLCKMIFKSKSRPTVIQRFEIPDNFTKPTVTFTFEKNTLGGDVKFEADYYIDEWIAAKMTTDWMPNDQQHTDQVSIFLFQIPVPITASTKFTHSSKLTFQSGRYMWDENAPAPTATWHNLSDANSGNALSILANLSLSQRHATMGVSYKSYGTGLTDATTGVGNTQLYGFQGFDIPGKPMSNVKFTDYGFTGQSSLVYDVFPPKFKMKDGQWVLVDKKPVPDPTDIDLGDYYIDPRKANVALEKDGGYHLRKVDISGTTNINPKASNQLSYGRFPNFPDHVTMHPAGFVVGVNQKYGKVMITNLFVDGAEDGDLPVARQFAGKALEQDRNGLLFQPLGVSCSYDGTILILDQLSNDTTKVARVQTFDYLGRPIQCFLNGDNAPTSILPLPTDVTYLDLQAVGNQESTFVLVLYFENDGSKVSDYHVDFYHYGTKIRTTNKVLTVNSVPAARLAMDMWHTMYTLNYEMTTDECGDPAGPKDANTGPAGRTVPSVSEWVPSVPGS